MNIRVISLLAATTLLTAPAIAADNYNVKEAAGATIAKAAKDVSSVWFDKQICVTFADTAVDCFTSINTKLDTVNTNLTTIDGRVDGIESLLTTENTNSTTLSGAVKAEDVASANADPGVVINTKRLDTAAASSGTDGDYQPLLTDGSGRLWVNCGTGCSGGQQYAEDVASANADIGTIAMAIRKATPANTSGTDGDYEPLQINGGLLWTNDKTLNTIFGTSADTTDQSGACGTFLSCVVSMRDDLRTMATDTSVLSVKTDQTTPGTTDLVHATGFSGTATTTITRPADASAYVTGESFGDSTGGHTLSSMCRASGGSGILTDATFVYSTNQVVVGTVFIYDSSVTEFDDNVAMNISDADQLKLVGTIPFTTVADTSNSYHNVQNLNIGYTCSGTANLRYQIRITTGYTPAASDTLTIRAKFIQSN